MATHSSILSLGNLIERAAWKVTVHGVRKEAVQFSLVQSLSRIQLFAAPWTEAHWASLSSTNLQSLLKLMSIKLLMLT